MKEMTTLQAEDINDIFIVIDKGYSKDHILSQYVGIDGWGYNRHLTHKFIYSYHKKFLMGASYYIPECHHFHLLHKIKLPFDIITMINQYLKKSY
jgi:hypothetical protein